MPLGAVKLKMQAEGFDPAILDLDLDGPSPVGGAAPPPPPPPPPPFSPPPPAAPALKLKDDPQYGK